jgi:hypothetical protein
MRRKNITTEDTNLSKKALALARAFKGAGGKGFEPLSTDPEKIYLYIPKRPIWSTYPYIA